MLFLSDLASEDPHCLLTPHCLLALSKVVSGKGKQEAVSQKDKVALSCKQPCSENVKWFSGRSVGATKETTQLSLASMGLFLVTVQHQVKIITVVGVQGLTGDIATENVWG